MLVSYCRNMFNLMLSAFMMSVVMLNVIMLVVVALNVVAPLWQEKTAVTKTP